MALITSLFKGTSARSQPVATRECSCPCSTSWTVVQHDGPDHLELWTRPATRDTVIPLAVAFPAGVTAETVRVPMVQQVSHGLQLQSTWRTPAAAAT